MWGGQGRLTKGGLPCVRGAPGPGRFWQRQQGTEGQRPGTRRDHLPQDPAGRRAGDPPSGTPRWPQLCGPVPGRFLGAPGLVCRVQC